MPKSFDQWFIESTKRVTEELPLTDDELENLGLHEVRDGVFEARCRSCGRDYEIYCEPKEFNPDYSYCGSGPSCVP